MKLIQSTVLTSKISVKFHNASKSFCLHENNSKKVLLLCVLLFFVHSFRCQFSSSSRFIREIAYLMLIYSIILCQCSSVIRIFVRCVLQLKNSDCVCEFAKYSYESSLYVVTHKEKQNFSLVVCLGYSRF